MHAIIKCTIHVYSIQMYTVHFKGRGFFFFTKKNFGFLTIFLFYFALPLIIFENNFFFVVNYKVK